MILTIVLRKTNLTGRVVGGRAEVGGTILNRGGADFSIYFKPAAIALVSDPPASSSFNAHT